MFPWVAAMRTYRKTNALHAKLRVMKERIRPTDGCMGFGLKYFGGHTGRWSGDSGFNMQNLPRGESHGADLRGCIVPRPGKEFIVCDLSQIEPRVLAWLCGDTLMLEQLVNGIPLYEAHARATMGWTGGNLKKENAELYSLAKARVLGLGYGCGPGRFVEVARTMAGITITPQEATRTVESFRGSNRKITALWNRLQNDFHRSAGGDFVVELPSGRKLTYRDVRSSGGWTARVERGGRRIPFYGGKLCENLVQAVARDVFGESLLRLHRLGVEVVFHVHDEAVCEVTPGTDPKEIERIMSITPDWLTGCPLAAEAVVTTRYCK
jgi:DNA polymerase